MRRGVFLGVACALAFLVAAGPATASDGAAAKRLGAALQRPFSPASSAAAVEALARAGVAVHDDALRRRLRPVGGRPSALRMTAFQARNMALEVSARGGVAGRDLALLVPADARRPSLATAVAAYARTGKSFGALLSRRLLAGQPLAAPDRATFPTLVLALYLADASRGAPVRSSAAAASGPCTAIAGFLGAAGTAAVSAAVRSLPFVREAVVAVTLLVTVRSLLTPWTVTVGVRPNTAHKPVGSATREGTMTARVRTGGGFRWPAAVQACARLATGAPLPEPRDARGAPVTWTPEAGFPEHATQTSAETQLDAAASAEFRYRLRPETESVHASGRERYANLVVEAKVLRRDVLDIVSTAVRLTAGIPGAAGVLAGPVGNVVASLLGPTGRGIVLVAYHEAQPAYVDVPGPVAFRAYSCTGLDGEWRARLTFSGGVTGSGTATWTFSPAARSAPLRFAFPLAGPGATLAYDYDGVVRVVGPPDAPVLQAVGEAYTTLPYVGKTGAAGPGSAPIRFGPVAECPA